MKAQPVIVGVEKPRRHIAAVAVIRLHRRRVENVEAEQRGAVAVSPRAFDAHVGQAAHRENVARAHGLEQVAHRQVHGRLQPGGGHAGGGPAVLDQAPRPGFDGEADDVEMAVTLCIGFARGLERQRFRHRAVFRPEDNGDRRLVLAGAFHAGLGGKRHRPRRRAHAGEDNRFPALDADRRRTPQHLDHALHVFRVVGRGVCVARILFAVAFPIDRRGDRRLEAERAAHPRDVDVLLRPIEQHFLFRRFVVGDGFERDVRHDAADFLSLAVGFTQIYKAAGGAAFRLFQPEVIERSGKQPLPRQRHRHPRRIACYPAPPQLLGAPSRSSGAAGRIEDEIARIGSHQQATLYDLGVRLHDIQFLVVETAGCSVCPYISPLLVRKIRCETPVMYIIRGSMYPACRCKSFQAIRVACFPMGVRRRLVNSALELERLLFPGRSLSLQVIGLVQPSALGQRRFAAFLRRAYAAKTAVRQQYPPRIAVANPDRLLLERFAHFQPFGVFRIPEQKIAKRRDCFRLKARRGLKRNLRHEAIRAEHFVHDFAHMMQVGVGHLHENAPRRVQQLARQQKPVAQVRQIRMDAELPCVAVRLHRFRLARQAVVVAVDDIALAHEGLEVRAELHAVRRIDIDRLHLPAEPLVAEQRVHDDQRIAEDQPVDPAVAVFVSLQYAVAQRQIAFAEQVERPCRSFARMAFQRLQYGGGRKPLMNEQRQGRDVERQPFGLPRPVQKGPRQRRQFVRRGPRRFQFAPRPRAVAFRRRIRPVENSRERADMRLQRGNFRFRLFARGVPPVPVERGRKRRIVVVAGGRLFLAELRLRPDVGPEQRAGFRVRVGAGLRRRPGRFPLRRGRHGRFLRVFRRVRAAPGAAAPA